ncbi:MAG: bacteriohemerythrin [Sulfuritalea sp.]|nr:bacteriohemerythrin [Sulfuritalea sp.]MDP1982279.1 bacteriohemerythrin [Sulfuritalea sp.]
MSTPTSEQEIQELRKALALEKSAHERTRNELVLTELTYRLFVPSQFMKLMGANSILQARLGQHAEQSLTILFSDIRDFATLSESMNQQENFRFLNSYLGEVGPIIERFGGFIDKFVGDGIMALFPSGSDDGLRAAIGMLRNLRTYNDGRQRARYYPLRIGVGLNSGITMLGTIGAQNRMETTVIGDTVNVASRLQSLTRIYGTPLLISEHTLYDLADASIYSFRLIDRVRVKGKIHPQSVYEVFDADPDELREAKLRTQSLFGRAVACYHLRDVAGAHALLLQCREMGPPDSVVELYIARCERFLATGEHEGTGELDLIPEWREEFSIGDPRIDGQHRQLLEQMRRLSDRVNSGSHQEVSEVLDFLGRYVVEHFRDEEHLMHESHYPFLEQHVHEHRTFQTYYLKLRAEIETGNFDPTYINFRIQLLLVDWLINHTTKTDRHLGSFLRNPTMLGPEPGFVH